jgi:hypothetical protein
MRAFRPRINERAGRPRRIVEQRLVPEARGGMRIERHLRGRQRRETVIIVERVEEADMQNGLYALAGHLVTNFVAERAIDVSRGPAVASRLDAHAIRPQRIELTQLPLEKHGFDIGVAVEQQIGANRLDKRDAGVGRVRAFDQREQRMVDQLRTTFIHQPGHGGRRLRHHAHAAMADGVALIAFADHGGAVARGPLRQADGMHGEQLRRARIFRLARRRSRAEEA